MLLAHLLHGGRSGPLHGLQDVDAVVELLDFGLLGSLDFGFVVVGQALEGYLPVAGVAGGERDEAVHGLLPQDVCRVFGLGVVGLLDLGGLQEAGGQDARARPDPVVECSQVRGGLGFLLLALDDDERVGLVGLLDAGRHEGGCVRNPRDLRPEEGLLGSVELGVGDQPCLQLAGDDAFDALGLQQSLDVQGRQFVPVTSHSRRVFNHEVSEFVVVKLIFFRNFQFCHPQIFNFSLNFTKKSNLFWTFFKCEII